MTREDSFFCRRKAYYSCSALSHAPDLTSEAVVEETIQGSAATTTPFGTLEEKK